MEPKMSPMHFLDEAHRLAIEMQKATSEKVLQTLKDERRKLGEAYREWHLKTYGWAYGSY